MRICGMDPGNKGAIAVIDSEDHGYVALHDLHRANFYESAMWLHHQKPEILVVEEVHAIRGTAANTMFGFGRSVGKVHALAELIGKGKEFYQVPPKKWQKFIGVTKKGDEIKLEVAAIAKQHFPLANFYGPRGGFQDGRSDALMIAYYGLHHFTQHKE